MLILFTYRKNLVRGKVKQNWQFITFCIPSSEILQRTKGYPNPNIHCTLFITV